MASWFPTSSQQESVNFNNLSLDLKPSTKRHLAKVYSNLAVMVALTCVGVLIDTQHLIAGVQGGMMSSIGCLLCICKYPHVVSYYVCSHSKFTYP